MTNVVDFQAVDNLKVMVILLSVFDDILIVTCGYSFIPFYSELIILSLAGI